MDQLLTMVPIMTMTSTMPVPRIMTMNGTFLPSPSLPISTRPQVVYWLRRDGQVQDPDMRIAVEAGHFTEMLVLLVPWRGGVVPGMMRLTSMGWG